MKTMLKKTPMAALVGTMVVVLFAGIGASPVKAQWLWEELKELPGKVVEEAKRAPQNVIDFGDNVVEEAKRTPQNVIDFGDNVVEEAKRTPQNLENFLRELNPVSLHAIFLVRQAREYYRNRARHIPYDIKQQLRPYFSNHILNKAQYVVERGAMPTLPNVINSMMSRDYAVVVGHIIVFEREPGQNLVWWAHELEHVAQYDSKGIDRFVGEYVTGSYSDRESEAKRKENEVIRGINNRYRTPPTVTPNPRTRTVTPNPRTPIVAPCQHRIHCQHLYWNGWQYVTAHLYDTIHRGDIVQG